jgi:hypothetical protein
MSDPVTRSSKKTKARKRSGSEKRKRQPRVILRVSPQERAEMRANAAAVGLSLSSFIRSLACTRPTTRPVRHRPPPEARLLMSVLGQCGRIGGNIYQLVRGMNLGDIPRSPELDAAGKETRAFLAAAREAFGL